MSKGFYDIHPLPAHSIFLPAYNGFILEINNPAHCSVTAKVLFLLHQPIVLIVTPKICFAGVLAIQLFPDQLAVLVKSEAIGSTVGIRVLLDTIDRTIAKINRAIDCAGRTVLLFSP